MAARPKTIKRNKKIFLEHLQENKDTCELGAKYNLQPSTVYCIIKQMERRLTLNDRVKAKTDKIKQQKNKRQSFKVKTTEPITQKIDEKIEEYQAKIDALKEVKKLFVV